jgi:hypothetical protein
MRTVPRNYVQRIMYYQIHAPRWVDEAPHIGVSDEVLVKLEAALAEAKSAYSRQHELQQQARSATLRLRLALKRLSKMGSVAVQQIRAAGDVGGSEVYTRAHVPRRKRHSRAPEPGTPTEFVYELLASGWIRAKWKCANPRGTQGTLYRIEREIGHGGTFEPVGTVGVKKFIDRSIPPGTAQVVYRITALRSTGPGQPACFIVNFGGTWPGNLPAYTLVSDTPVLPVGPAVVKAA